MASKPGLRRTPSLGAPFDPSKVTDDFIRENNLPPRPATRTALDNWMRALKESEFPEPRPLLMAAADTAPRLRSIQSPQGSQEASRNWSGAYVRPRGGNMVLVQGWWTMPAVPPGATPAQTYSIWVGLDGHDPASTLMPQIGVGYLGEKVGGVPQQKAFAWWQWWDEFNPQGLQTIIPEVPVEQGDEIYAQVMALDQDEVSFLIVNTTKRKAFHSISPAPTLGPNNQRRPKTAQIEGRTAEWIVEQPTLFDRPDLKDVELGKYGKAVFKHCTAASRDEDGNLVEFQLEHARAMRMNLWYDRSNPGRVASVPTIDRAKGELELTYVGPG